jgi:hypothetical protein
VHGLLSHAESGGGGQGGGGSGGRDGGLDTAWARAVGASVQKLVPHLPSDAAEALDLRAAEPPGSAAGAFSAAEVAVRPGQAVGASAAWAEGIGARGSAVGVESGGRSGQGSGMGDEACLVRELVLLAARINSNRFRTD